MQWLLIGGAPRSGTTLVFHLLKAHPAIAISNERQLLRKIRDHGTAAIQQQYLEVLTEEQRRQIRWVGEKIPEYYESNPDRLFQPSHYRIIHISRRPSAVIASMLERSRHARQGQDPRWSRWFGIMDALDTWLRAWQFALQQRGNPSFLHLKYEDILAHPRQQLDRMTRHLGLQPAPLDASMLASRASKPLDENATRQVAQHLGEAEQVWNLDLAELESRLGHLRPSWSSAPRRLKRRLLWLMSTNRSPNRLSTRSGDEPEPPHA
ncbi:MAG: sulfotransferase, partial [Xanthomonadales bacterium]|nr:sulfotransferase [Xanthomonadales bacterium]